VLGAFYDGGHHAGLGVSILLRADYPNVYNSPLTKFLSTRQMEFGGNMKYAVLSNLKSTTS